MKIFSRPTIIYLLQILFVNGMHAQTLTDYDGNIYKTITIGTQVWMGENLRSLHYADGTEIPYIWSYNNSDSLTAIYGLYYSWASAMRGAASSNGVPSGVQGVCPEGWHIPSIAEWDILVDYYGGQFEAGGKLKEKDTLHWTPPNAGATNESGFTGLPGGSVWESGGSLMGETGFWWTSVNDNDFIYDFLLGNEVPYAITIGTYVSPDDVNKGGESVRCLRNAATHVSIIEDLGKFSVYPNPASDFIIIWLENNTNIDLSVFGLDGKLLMQRQIDQQETLIDIRDLPEGIYLVSVRSSQGIKQKRIIKIQ